MRPSPGCSTRRNAAPPTAPPKLSFGTSAFGSQAQVFRNQSVGSRRSGAASPPRFTTVSRIRTSSGVAFAYSAKTSKYRFSSKTPESRRSEEHTSELQSLAYLVCRLLLEKKKKH